MDGAARTSTKLFVNDKWSYLSRASLTSLETNSSCQHCPIAHASWCGRRQLELEAQPWEKSQQKCDPVKSSCRLLTTVMNRLCTQKKKNYLLLKFVKSAATKISLPSPSICHWKKASRAEKRRMWMRGALTSQVVNMFGFDRQFRSHPTMGKYFNDKTFSFRFDFDEAQKNIYRQTRES